MPSRLHLVLAFFLLLCGSCLAAEVQVVVTNAQGQPLKNALVILQELGPPDRELFRALTNDNGVVAHEFAPGLYRAISTCPYSPYQTRVREFLVGNLRGKVTLEMEKAEGLDSVPVSIGRLTLHVLDGNGQPAADARVLVRDAEAHPFSEHWGTTNAQGTTSLELSGDPAVLLVVYRDRLYTFPANSWETERTLRLK